MAIKCPKCHSENSDSSRYCGSCAAALGREETGSQSLTKTLQIPVQGLTKGSLIAGKYKIIEELGRGGMGIVYKAEDTKLQRIVALKFLPPQWTSDPEARERFIHEARAASALDHPNICTIYEIGETEDGRMFIAMGCYEGESLREKLRRGLMKAEYALDIAAQVALGMEKAHGKGIIHRDIKPANILVTNEGVAKVVDFGLAKLAGQVKLTREGTTVGTVAYMSPEQAKGEPVDQRTDIWSLGVVLYEMVSGRLPFKGDYEQSLIHSILKTDPEPIGKIRKDLPKGLESIVFKALEKNPNTRYQVMGELLEDLKAVAEGLKPLRAKSGLFRGKIFGIRKTYAYAGLACLAIFAAVILFLTNTVRITSLAVLPLQNLSGDPSQEFFADGMTDALISDLAQIKAFNKVISRTSVMQYKDTKKSLPQIARELGVDLIVEASVTRSRSRVGIRARLMEARQERQLWASTYEREMTEVLALQSELVQAIAGEIRVHVTPQERKHLSRERLVNPEAYEAFLMGRLFLNKATAPAVEKSIDQFRKAIEKDPKNAAAYVGLVDAYGLLGQMASLPSAEVASQQRKAAQKALEIDETLAEGHIALGNVKRGLDWDWEGAEREYKRAIELNPNSADARLWYSQLLGLIGRNEEALAQITRARVLDPLNPFIAANVLWRLYYIGRYDEAIADSQKLLEVYPDYWLNYWARGYLFSAKGMYEEAIAEHQNAVTLSEGSLECLPDLGYAYAKAGKTEEALKVLDKLREESKKRYVPAGLFAPVYLGLGERERVFEYLESAYQEHDEHTAWLLIDPLFEPLRPDSRFQDLRRRMKLPG